MSEKRRDNKNRILRAGESQRKDGRYAYKYLDASGKQQFVYAWRLVPTDRTPAGKREDRCLREKIKDIQKDMDDGIDTLGKKMTVCQLYEKYTRYNGNVRAQTVHNRLYLIGLLKEDKLGNTNISNVKISDAKEWILRLKTKSFAYTSIRNYKRSLKAAFHMAVQDDCIRKNPFDFDITSVLENDTVKKEALTPIQEESLLEFIQSHKSYRKYYDDIVVLLDTGLRVSELCGLTDDDVDYETNMLRVDHQLIWINNVGYMIQPPKTKSGVRQIPMTDRVVCALQRIMKNRDRYDKKEIDGYTNFLFVSPKGNPHIAKSYDRIVQNIVKKYRQTERIPLPKTVTPHTFRHTFCTKMANAGMNPKALQYLMGHGDINMTLNYYAHISFDSAKAEMERLSLV